MLHLNRLDKLLADSGQFTRSEARNAIRSGRVTVNGIVESKPEAKYDEESGRICIDGETINCASKRYLMLYKPAGVLSATDDPRQPTVLDLLPRSFQRLKLFPVGRLDKDTTGLLLLTNDGDFAHRVISPKKHVPKRYRAVLDRPVTAEDVQAFADGIMLADGTQCLPAVLAPSEETTGIVTVYEGKYHQVKRMFASRGKAVTALHREQIGALVLDPSLFPGDWRELREEELALVFQETL